MKISSLKLTDLLFYLCQEYNPAVENTDLSKPQISSTFNPNVLLPDAHIQESANLGIESVFIVRVIEVKFDDIPSSGSLFYSLKHVRFTQCPFQWSYEIGYFYLYLLISGIEPNPGPNSDPCELSTQFPCGACSKDVEDFAESPCVWWMRYMDP